MKNDKEMEKHLKGIKHTNSLGTPLKDADLLSIVY